MIPGTTTAGISALAGISHGAGIAHGTATRTGDGDVLSTGDGAVLYIIITRATVMDALCGRMVAITAMRLVLDAMVAGHTPVVDLMPRVLTALAVGREDAWGSALRVPAADLCRECSVLTVSQPWPATEG